MSHNQAPPRRRLSSILDAALTPLHAPKDQHKIVCIYFHHCGIHASPGRLRVYEKLLLSLWTLFGPVSDVFYEPLMRHCVLTYRDFLDATNAMDFLNDSTNLSAALDVIVAAYADAQDREMAERIVQELFVPCTSGGGWVSAYGCSTCRVPKSS